MKTTNKLIIPNSGYLLVKISIDDQAVDGL